MDSYGNLNLNIAKDFNSHSSGLNGIIAKLAGFDVNKFQKSNILLSISIRINLNK